MWLRYLALPAIAGLIFGLAPAIAQDDAGPTPGRVYASSYGPVPENTLMVVRPLDNSAANLRVKNGFAEALSRRGVKLTETGAQLALNFETEVESLGGSGAGPSLGQIKAENEDKRIRMNFWSTTQDSILTGRQGSGGSSGTVRYILRATIDDQRTGQRLWQSEASYTGAPSDEVSAFIGMTPVIVEGLGQSVRPKGFRLE